MLVLLQMAVAEPFGIVALRVVDPVVVETPAAFLPEQRCARGHLGAVENHAHFHRPHQFVRMIGLYLRDVGRDLGEALQADFHLAGDLGRLQVVVDEAAQLVFDLRWRQALFSCAAGA